MWKIMTSIAIDILKAKERPTVGQISTEISPNKFTWQEYKTRDEMKWAFIRFVNVVGTS